MDSTQIESHLSPVVVSLLLIVLFAPLLLLLREERGLDPDLSELLDELARLVHVQQDVAAAHELALQVDLDRWIDLEIILCTPGTYPRDLYCVASNLGVRLAGG